MQQIEEELKAELENLRDNIKKIDEIKPSTFSLNNMLNEYYKMGFNDAKNQIKELLEE